MSETCSSHKENEKSLKHYGRRNLMEKTHLGDEDADGKILDKHGVKV
jgi:hypothetical protein